MMTIIPNQFFGIGDVIFCQTLVRTIADGRPIIWPVLPHFVEGLNRAYPDIKFVDYRRMQIDFERKDQYEFEHPEIGRCTVLPLRWADYIMKVPYNDCMKAKYMLYGMDFEIWRDCAMWVRYDDKEQELMKQTGSIYHETHDFVNTTFGSDCKMNIQIPRFSVPVYLEVKAGFSLFDWAAIVQKSREIHTVNTSIIYLLEMTDLRAPEIHLYQRGIAGQTFDNIKYILKRHKYIFHP